MKKVMEVFDMLEDDISKDIYLHRLNYLLTGNFNYLKTIVDRYLLEIKRSDRELCEDLEIAHRNQNVIIWGLGIMFCRTGRLA